MNDEREAVIFLLTLTSANTEDPWRNPRISDRPLLNKSADKAAVLYHLTINFYGEEANYALG